MCCNSLGRPNERTWLNDHYIWISIAGGSVIYASTSARDKNTHNRLHGMLQAVVDHTLPTSSDIILVSLSGQLYTCTRERFSSDEGSLPKATVVKQNLGMLTGESKVERPKTSAR